MDKLYLLMRHDMRSMNTGKACAQAHHAGTHFISNWKFTTPDRQSRIMAWEGGRGFGTVYTLGVNYDELIQKFQMAIQANLIASLIEDPTYPLRDGDFTHYLPVVTCGYIFGNSAETGFLADLKLHR